MPTTSQGVLTFNDTAPEVFLSLNATIILGGYMFAMAGALLLLWLLKVAFPALSEPIFSNSLSDLSQNHVQAHSEWSTFNKHLIRRTAGVTLPFLLQWIYLVVTVEQTIQWNPVIHHGPRFPITFGQVCCSLHVDYYVC